MRPTGILTVDTGTWIQSEDVPTVSFLDFTVARDGARVFTVDRDTGGVLAQVTIDPGEARNAATEDLGKIADLPQVILYAS